MIKLADNWKARITQLLVFLGLIDPSFTGRIVINVNQGNVCDAELEQRFK